ncbi:MAG: hypothetical protein DRN78_04685 [Thermoproteota archaeon]|nr:MAG: hypothetical protein DRN78_04685 [Candidatus Korarchaeota archaeon]
MNAIIITGICCDVPEGVEGGVVKIDSVMIVTGIDFGYGCVFCSEEIKHVVILCGRADYSYICYI